MSLNIGRCPILINTFPTEHASKHLRYFSFRLNYKFNVDVIERAYIEPQKGEEKKYLKSLLFSEPYTLGFYANSQRDDMP